MEKVKLIVEIKMPDAPMAPPAEPSFEDKVCYALECVETGDRKQEAISFLRKAYHFLEKKRNLKKEETELMRSIHPVLSEYGTYITSRQENGNG